jgi:hypothetical protein
MHHNFRGWELNSKKYIILACSSNFYTLSLDHFAFESSSIYKIEVVKHLVYQFWFLSIDAALCQLSSQSGIEHLTLLSWLEFGVYVNLCLNEVKNYILAWNLLCIICMSRSKHSKVAKKYIHLNPNFKYGKTST